MAFYLSVNIFDLSTFCNLFFLIIFSLLCLFQPADVGQWWVPDQHEQRLVREVKEHRQVEQREKEGMRRARIQSSKETRQQVSRSFSGRHRVMKEGSRGGNMAAIWQRCGLQNDKGATSKQL